MAADAYAAAHAALESRLTPKALRHSVAVAEEAARLARLYEVDIDRARIAGLLHDWAREDGDESLRADARAADTTFTDVDREVPYLLHGPVGARGVREAFPDLPADVVQAVSRHTMGARDMSDLDIVVYVADMTEPRRSFRGVKKLRALAGEVPLRSLYAEAYATSIRHLVAERKRIHPSTVEAWNAIVSEESQ